jgi:hypothetical protein
LKFGNKPLDTSIGLVNVIRDFYSIKSRINEFLRLCPKSPIIIKLIDTDETLVRLDIILNAFKENLGKIDKVPPGNPKKRKLEIENDDDEFDITQTNTSTPETVINPSKRKRMSLTTPFLTLSANKEIKIRTADKSLVMNRSELNYTTSSDTSGKEDDGMDEEEEKAPGLSTTPAVLIPEVN